MDVLVDLPGIAVDIADAANRSDCSNRVAKSFAALRTWRQDWQAEHAASVRQGAGGQSCLEFDSPRLALDILYYNAGLVYLMQLDALARSQTPPSLQRPRYECWGKTDVQKHPLLLPDQVRFLYQPAVEALRTIPYLAKSLMTTSSRETVVPPAPVGIVYAVLRSGRQFLADADPALPKHVIFQDAGALFAGYSVSGV